MFKCLTAGKYIQIRMYLFSQSAVFFNIVQKGVKAFWHKIDIFLKLTQKTPFKGRIVLLLGYILNSFLRSMPYVVQS